MNYRLIIFDVDGTLIQGKRWFFGLFGPRHKFINRKSWQEFIPGVLDQLHAMSDVQFGIASNQAGVAFNYCDEHDVVERMHDIIEKVGIDPRLVRYCLFHPKSPDEFYRRDNNDRKPKPGMLLDIMRVANVEPQDTLFIGDMETDKQAAENAGIDFQWAWDFFGRGK